MKRLNSYRPQLSGSAIGLFAVLTALSTTACHRDLSDDSSGPANENLALTNSGSSTLTAKFRFPNDHRQALAAPTGHALEGANFVTEADSFNRDITIVMKEGVPVATNKIAKELGLQSAMTAAGPAVLITSLDQIADATRAVELTLPVKVSQTDVSQNLTVIYRVIQQGQGGKTVTGLMPLNRLEKGDRSVRFHSNFLGVFQAVYYNADPSAVREIRSSDGFFGLDDPQAKLPESFILRTPTGQVVGTYPQASWSTSIGASHYEVSITRNKECTDVAQEYAEVTSALKTLEGLSEGNYYLCVSAVSPGGTRTPASNNGLAFQLTFSHIGLFHYDGPKVFATGTPQIRWTAAQNATKYSVAMSNAAGCPGATYDTTTQLSWTPSTRRTDGTYFVCVAALDETGHKQMIDPENGRPFGEGLSITIDTTMPGNFDVLGLGGPRGVVTWSQSSEAVMYNLTIGTDSSCSQVYRSYRNIVGTQTSVQVAGLQENSSYNVCLSAIDNAGNVRVANNNGTRMTFDTTPPSVVNVESANSPGSYGLGVTVTIVVNFSEPVVLNGSGSDARLLLNTGSYATYTSGNGSARWLFSYKVASGANAKVLDYSNTGALTLGSSGGRDNAGNFAVLSLPATGSENSLAVRGRISIDTVAPSMVSSSPANNARDVSVRPDMSFVLSEAPNGSSGIVTVTKVAEQTDVSSNFETSFDATNLTLRVSLKSSAAALASASSYKVQLRGFRDAAGNEMPANIIQFTTK